MRLPGNTHPYLALRLRLTQHALRQFVASLASSAEITLLLAGPILFGLLSMIALPSLYAASLPWPNALAIVLAQALATCLPVWLLRKRVLPAPLSAWLRSLPISPRLRWGTDAAVAAILMLPLVAAYALSAGIWLYQWPLWLRPVAVQGIGATLLACLLAWLATIGILALRMAPPRPARRASTQAHDAFTPHMPRWRTLFLWRHLFWLPFWRNDNVIGLQQTLLLAGALASMAAWLLRTPFIPAPLLALLASACLVIITDRGDKAVREQIAVLRPSFDAWPISASSLIRLACGLSLLPALSVLVTAGALLAAVAPAVLQQRVTLVYAITAGTSLLAIVGLPRLATRARVALVVFSIFVLSAIGSELWT